MFWWFTGLTFSGGIWNVMCPTSSLKMNMTLHSALDLHSLLLKCLWCPNLFPALCETNCNCGDVFGKSCIFPWQKTQFIVCRTVQDLLSPWWQAVNHQGNHKALKRLLHSHSPHILYPGNASSNPQLQYVPICLYSKNFWYFSVKTNRI